MQQFLELITICSFIGFNQDNITIQVKFDPTYTTNKIPEINWSHIGTAIFIACYKKIVSWEVYPFHYLRTTALTGKVVVIPGMADAAGQLHRIGVNLNQLTRSANEGSIHCVDLRETKQEVGKVWQFLNSQTPRVL